MNKNSRATQPREESPQTGLVERRTTQRTKADGRREAPLHTRRRVLSGKIQARCEVVPTSKSMESELLCSSPGLRAGAAWAAVSTKAMELGIRRKTCTTFKSVQTLRLWGTRRGLSSICMTGSSRAVCSVASTWRQTSLGEQKLAKSGPKWQLQAEGRVKAGKAASSGKAFQDSNGIPLAARTTRARAETIEVK